MPVYLVACDLQEEVHDYEDFHLAVGRYDSTKLLESVYLIDAPADADTLRRHLSAVAAKGDRIWVCRLTEEHSGYVLAPAAEWLDSRKPL